MPSAAALGFFEPRALLKGLLAFFLLTLVLPVAVTVVASFGPKEWMAHYVHPAFQFNFLLFAAAGAAAARISKATPILNTILVGILGTGLSFLVAALVNVPPFEVGPIERFVFPVVTSTAWCFFGGLCVVLFRRKKSAL